MFGQNGNDLVGKALEVGIHSVQRHLYGVEGKPVLEGRIQHLQMNVRVLMPCESDIAELAGLFRLQSRFERAVGAENAVGVTRANDFMKLDEVDHIRL